MITQDPENTAFKNEASPKDTRNGGEEKDKRSESETLLISDSDRDAAIEADIDAEINAQMNAHANDTAASQTDQTTDDEGPCGR